MNCLEGLELLVVCLCTTCCSKIDDTKNPERLEAGNLFLKDSSLGSRREFFEGLLLKLKNWM